MGGQLSANSNAADVTVYGIREPGTGFTDPRML